MPDAPTVFFILVSVHLLSAVAWIGGMIFLSLVLAPLVRSRKASAEQITLFRSAARRFRLVVWTAIALLLSTGPALLHQRGLSLFEPSQWPQVLRLKIGAVMMLLVLTSTHDLLLGPQVRKIGAIPSGTGSSWEQVLVHVSSWVPRVALLLALGVLSIAVVLART